MTSKNFNVLEFKNRPNLFKEISKESIWKRLLELSISEVVEKECSICMNLIENIDSASILKCCGQFSCTECVLNCLRASRSCPFCRSLQYSPLKAIDLFRFQESVLASSSEELASSTSQITPSTKLSMLFVTLKSIMEEFLEDKIIIFSQFQGFLDIVQSELRRHQLAMLRFDGSMSIGERDSVINEFTKNPSVKILLMSLKCGNMGVNIVAANHIILLDPWWNPMIRRQAVARCHRIGQNKPVYIYRMMIKDTVEERLFEVEKSKEFLFDSLMNDSPCRGNAQRLDVGEIRMLFGV